MPATKNTVTGTDAEGRAAKTSFQSDTAPHALALAQAIVAASNASLPFVLGFSKQATGGGAAVNAEFPSEQDKAVLVFKDVYGAVHKYSVPAPKAALFDANGRTITHPGGGSDALIAAYIAGATDDAGNLTLVWARGHRSFRKSRKF